MPRPKKTSPPVIAASIESDENVIVEKVKNESALAGKEDLDSISLEKKSNKRSIKLQVSGKPEAKRRLTTKAKTEDDEKPKETKRAGKKVAAGETEEQKQLRETVGKDVLATVGNSKKMLGYHVSAAGSVETSIYNAVSTGCRAFALFVRNQRTWNHKPMEEEKVIRWNAAIEETKFDLNQILPHGSYLINPGSPNEENLKKSRDAMLDECSRCERLGLKLYNFHPGSSTGACTADECIKIVADTMNFVIKNTKFITLVIETMARQGHSVGGTFKEIRKMIDLIEDKSRVGVCIDTCHIFAAGYDIRSKASYEKMMTEFDETIGFEYLKAFHINDSKGDLGCKLDRHENIGKGKIGKKGFEHIMNDNRLDGIPLILETPEGQYPEEMKLMYNMDTANEKKNN